MPKIANYRRTRHIELDEIDEELRTRMRRHRVCFELRFGGDSYSHDEDEEWAKLDGHVAKHTQGVYSLVTNWDNIYYPDTDEYKGMLNVEIMFETLEDLENFEKLYVLVEKLST